MQKGEEPPKHATAFLDAAFRLLVAACLPGDGGADALAGACGSLCDAVVDFRGGAGADDAAPPDCRSCVRAALCRLAKQHGVRGARAALLAASERLRDVTERCADVARAAAAGASSAAAAAAASPQASAADAQRQYDNVYFLVRVIEAALAALASPPQQAPTKRRGAAPASWAPADVAAATAAMEAFARVHARAQRCAEALRPRFGLLSVAVRRVTAAANLVALSLLTQSD